MCWERSNDIGTDLFSFTYRPVAKGWHGVANATPWATGSQLFATPKSFVCNFYCCLMFVHKKRFPEIFVQLNLGLCDILESSIFSCTHIVNLIVIA